VIVKTEPKKTAVEKLIEDRERTVGNFTDQSEMIEQTLTIWMDTKNWDDLLPYEKQALRMLLHKVGRILVGDAHFKEHWVDAEGYIHLVVQRLGKEPDYPGTPEDGGQHA
jgi:hypothetical protein